MTFIALGPGREFDRIRDIATALGDAAGPLGDDTAIVADGHGKLVVSTDISVDEVHFRHEWISPDEIGWRATASALSDLAAAAATPAGVLVALAVPRQLDDTAVIQLMTGVGDAARFARCQVIGGDLSTAAVLSITVTVFGYAAVPLSRRGARPGDAVWVSGTLGGARAAVDSWLRGDQPTAAARAAFARPYPQLELAQWLANHGATSMIDISDGFAGDIQHLAAASAVGITVDADLLPLHEALAGADDAVRQAAIGGEDYQLLVSMPREFVPVDAPARLTRVGEVTTGPVVLRRGAVVLDLRSYQHAV